MPHRDQEKKWRGKKPFFKAGNEETKTWKQKKGEGRNIGTPSKSTSEREIAGQAKEMYPDEREKGRKSDSSAGQKSKGGHSKYRKKTGGTSLGKGEALSGEKEQHSKKQTKESHVTESGSSRRPKENTGGGGP